MITKYSSLVFSMLCLFALTYSTLLPILTPDMAMQSPKRISLENAHGAISTEKSKKIIEKIKRDGLETNIFDKHLPLISEVVGSPLMVGNKVDLLCSYMN